MGCHAGIELDHGQLAAGGVVEKFHVEHAMGKTDGAQELACHLQRLLMHRLGQSAGIVETHEGFGSRVHHCLHDPDLAHDTVKNITVQVVLRAPDGGLEQHAVCRAGLRQALPHDLLERLDQVPNDPQFPAAEPRVLVQLLPAGYGCSQYRKSRFDRFGKLGVAEACRYRLAVGNVQRLERKIGLRANPLQHLAGIQLVLAGEHGLHRCAWPTHTFCQQSGCKRAELLVVRDDGLPTRAAGSPLQAIYKTVHVEPGQPRIAWKRK